MDSNTLRQKFLAFFERHGHTVRPSASVIPTDPTLLLNNAGMVPFKPYFLGEEEAPYDRAVTSQKCVRTIDIDIIGTTDRHLSFFEMLGNFSFGDYFKEGAVTLAYRFVTEELGLDPDRLWFTVYEDDDEAAAIWTDVVGVPEERVQRGGRDNFWQMGVAGPCGPASEIFYDRGPEHGHDGGPIGGDEDRFVEIWNLVFMQHIQDEPYHVIGDLPSKNIDTGMGLERLAMVMQEAGSLFETDLLRPVMAAGEEQTGASYGSNVEADVSLRILADHGRTTTVMIGDGVMPSNEGRGYVLRRLLRRAVRHAWQLGSRERIMPALVEASIDVLGDAYPILVEQRGFILDVVTREEDRFRKTLESGLGLLEDALEGVGEGGQLDGDVAFKLHDTYGFPIELTTEIISERGLTVDRAGFEVAMSEQRERARSAWKGGEKAAEEEAYRRLSDAIGLTDFLGYGTDLTTSRVLAIIRDGEQVEQAADGEQIEVFLDRTPFYGESGGQVGDTGTLTGPDGSVVVADTQHALQGLHGHRGTVTSGTVRVGQEVEAVIDSIRRNEIRKAHTGTHILYSALRSVVGDHVKQAGSLNEASRFRFDFSHFSGLGADEIAEVERLANERVISNVEVQTQVMDKDDALETGALAFFGDKYGDKVRVVRLGGFSVEFCGGTHTSSAGAVGPLVLLGESSIGANTRRVEALVGDAAYGRIATLTRDLSAAAALLKAPEDEVPARVESLLERTKGLERELAELKEAQRGAEAAELVDAAETIDGTSLLVTRRDGLRPDELREFALDLRGRLGSSLVIVGGINEGKGALVGAATDDLVEKGVSAGDIVGAAARELGGGGSRDPRLAQAGGPNGANIDAALDVAREEAGRAISG
ncbi:MAG: alanine--tRNA ligase [Acidimicrobiia bacterium]|nr:MAG: alanine--tRNA ligase [Acidimicrobiia bacterium]